MNIDGIKLILGITDSLKDNLLLKLKSFGELAVCSYVGSPAYSLPSELEWIVEEYTVIRYQRLGSEGLKEEQIDDALTSKYQEDILSSYYPFLDSYKEKTQTQTKHNKVRFL
ncbi:MULTISPECIES: phage head-tail connector protein [Gammaproteobacteria]|uniref:phage head-tail connector protein n=1 Tax=Acinetobacter sp. HRXRD-152 TaxID=3404808 RepID=UPI003BB62EF2